MLELVLVSVIAMMMLMLVCMLVITVVVLVFICVPIVSVMVLVIARMAVVTVVIRVLIARSLFCTHCRKAQPESCCKKGGEQCPGSGDLHFGLHLNVESVF